MINLYCYHSSAASSVGFQETVWTVKDGDCRLVSMELRQAIREGGAKALCLDTGRGTRAFMLRGIFVRTGDQSGWRMNVILETDEEDQSLWADVIGAFLEDYKGMTEKLAGLFFTEYEGGEHDLMDVAGFGQLVQETAGAAERLRNALKDGSRPGADLMGSLVEELDRPLRPEARRLILLVPEASAGYFMAHTSLEGLPAPEICISARQWSAFLAHEQPEKDCPEEDLPGEESRVQGEKTDRGFCPVCRGAMIFGVIAAAGLLLFMICRAVRRLKRKGE